MWWIRIALLTICVVAVVRGDSQAADENFDLKKISDPDVVSLDVKSDPSIITNAENIIESNKADRVKLCRRRRVRRRCYRRCRRCRRRVCRRCRRRTCRYRRRRHRRRYRCRRRHRRCVRRRYRRRYRCRRRRRRRCIRRRYKISSVYWRGRRCYVVVRYGRHILRFCVRYRYRHRRLYIYYYRRWHLVRRFRRGRRWYTYYRGRYVTRRRRPIRRRYRLSYVYWRGRRCYVVVRYGRHIRRFCVRYRYRHRRLYIYYYRRWHLVRRFKRGGTWYTYYRGQYVTKRRHRSGFFYFRRNHFYMRYRLESGKYSKAIKLRYKWEMNGKVLYYFANGRWQKVNAFGQYGALYKFNGRRFVIVGHWRPTFYFTWKGKDLWLSFRCGRQIGRYRVRYRWFGTRFRRLFYLDNGRWYALKKYTMYGLRYVYSNGRYSTSSRFKRKFYWKNGRLYVTIIIGRRVYTHVLESRYRGRQLIYWWGGKWYIVTRYNRGGKIYCYSNGRYSQSSSSSSTTTTTHTYKTYVTRSKPVVTTTTTTKHIYVTENGPTITKTYVTKS